MLGIGRDEAMIRLPDDCFTPAACCLSVVLADIGLVATARITAGEAASQPFRGVYQTIRRGCVIGFVG